MNKAAERPLRVPDSISRRTLEGIYAAVRNLDAGVVGDEFDLSEVHDLRLERLPEGP